MGGYASLAEHFRSLGLFSSAQGLLHWDAAVMLPATAAEGRAQQLALLSSFEQGLWRDSRLVDWFEQARQDEHQLTVWQKANLREMTRKWQRAKSIPPQLAADMTAAAVRCEQAWRQARKDDSFQMVVSHLTELIGYVRDYASCLAEALKIDNPYDALLDGYESGLSMQVLDSLFDPLASFLQDFIPSVRAEQQRHPPLPLSSAVGIEAQHVVVKALLSSVGFDFRRGRVDESAHPFCGGGEDDVRITLRYDKTDCFSAVMAVLHESGHALYEQGLPRDWHYQPVGQARGSAWHESQALLVEMQAARSLPFLRFLARLLQQKWGLDKTEPNWSAENLYRHSCRLRPNALRVDADEVTYPLHIILRYRIEKQIIIGHMAVKDIPDFWREQSRQLLGNDVVSDAQGCLQDIHWFEGLFGYFPCYTVGALMAAQLFQTLLQHKRDLFACLEQGDVTPLTTWLGETIHRRGSFYESDALMRHISGKPLSIEPFIQHLRSRYALAVSPMTS